MLEKKVVLTLRRAASKFTCGKQHIKDCTIHESSTNSKALYNTLGAIWMVG
jgi:hypothetical protein